MKTFLKKTLLFIGYSLIVIAILFWGSNAIVKQKSSFKLPASKTTIILGHSHSEAAYNDTIITNTVNLSYSGEAYFWTYAKLKQILKQNTHIERIFVEFTNNQIQSGMDDWTWSDTHLSNRLFTYFPFLSFEDIQLLYHNNSSGFVSATSKTFRRHIIKTLTNRHTNASNIGQYVWLQRYKIDSLIQHYNPKTLAEINLKLSEINLSYLRKIIDLSKAHNVELILIRTPQHSLFPGRRNESQFQEVLKTRFSDVPFLDFNDFKLKDSDFSDFDHLNHRGSLVFSKWFEKLQKKKR